MKTLRLFISICVMMVSLCGWGYDIEVDGIYYGIDGDNVYVTSCSYGIKYTGDVTIPSTVTYYGTQHSVTSIGNYAFCNCSGLTSVTIPNSVTSIGNYAFEGCSGLTSVTIPNSVTSIGEKAFYNCSGLTSVTIGTSVTSIGEEAFGNCSGLTSIIVESSNTHYDSRNNCNAIIETETNKLIIGCKNSFIPNGVVELGISCFSNCHLGSVIIPNSVEVIRRWAFHQNDLTSINIPNSVKEIGFNALCCNKLTELYIPRSVVKLGKDENGTQGSVAGANPLSTIVVDINNSNYNSLGNCNAIIETSTSTLIQGCKNTVIPSFVTGIGAVTAFSPSEWDDEPWSITLPENVKKVIDEAVYCHYILYNPYTECQGIKSVYIYSKEPPLVTQYGNYYFDDLAPIAGCSPLAPNLYIPKESFNKYLGNKHWNYLSPFRSIENDAIAFSDGMDYYGNEQETYDELEYHRSFNNTNWQALYVPFSMSYDDWKDEFEIGKINDVNMYDTDEDGTFDVTEVELLKLKKGSINPNTPYFIKAKTTGEKVITVENATLYPATENSIDCSSTEMKFTFTGTYSGVSGTDMYANKYYALAGGSLCYASNSSVSLKPMRWYMKSESRNGTQNNTPSNVRVRVAGEDVTGIAEVSAKESENSVYTLDGRLVNNETLAPGMYIKNGKKIIIR